ncbi:hypothetical protein ATE47_07555 [Chryseobacterium sp. IHB B 17019]|jgi:hypothetical protein|uniref:hypothetical protein n=1 Tax=Chryseobacterium sp. IHB B 17019 TaxID=1721091 RepID=UPI00071FA003|nr:hypothetical protein [Chryseobacterium sp. IHB B 17019]ALR30387.1 hypothetical protein ATE47_07555 [Chryseobacterium sp. IHB B 17019]
MKKLILLSSLSVFLLNCNKKTEAPVAETSTPDTTVATTTTADTLGTKSLCYMGVTGKDTVFVTIDDNLGTITGKMATKNSAKDSNKGDLSGIKSGDTLKLTYEFAAEGKTGNKNDIYFLQTKDGLTEGIGERDAETGTKYANDSKIKYQGGRNLKAADCNVVTKALK